MKSSNNGKTIAQIILILLCAYMSGSSLAADDAYLKALEAEAKNLKDSEQPSEKDTSPEQNAKKAATDKTVETQTLIQKSEFETALKGQLPNTHTIYLRLTPEQKMMVVELYFANSKNMAVASKQVFDFYLFDRKRATQRN